MNSCFHHWDTLAGFYRILPPSPAHLHASLPALVPDKMIHKTVIKLSPAAEIASTKPFSEDGIDKNTVPIPCTYNFPFFKTLFYPGNIAG